MPIAYPEDYDPKVGTPPTTQPKGDGVVENGGIWYHGVWFNSPANLKALGWSDAGWQQFLQQDNRYGDWADPTGNIRNPKAPEHPDGTVEQNGGIWYKGKVYDSPADLRGQFASDNAWYTFLNSNTDTFKKWWNDRGGDTAPKTTPGTDTGTTTTTAPAPTDWSIVLGTMGLPDDVVNELNHIWTRSNGDASVATPLAINYVMSTPWFKTNYAGFFTGRDKGLWGDIKGYAAYKNDANQLYQQYYGRAVTNGELVDYITSGKHTGQIANELSSAASQGTLSDPLKMIFTPEELKAFSDQKAGIDTALGQRMLKAVEAFTSVSPLFKNFYGRAPTRAELDDLIKNGTEPAQIAQQFKQAGYMDAINPILKNIFDPSELAAMAQEAAGADTPHGKQLLDMASLATSLNQVYLIHFGAPVTREELNSAYTKGYTADYVDKQLASGEFAGQLPQNIQNMFTQQELQQIGAQATGASTSAEGGRLLNLLKTSGPFAALANQYNQPLSRSELEGYFNTGFTSENYGQKLAGQAWASANMKDIQQASGSFGEGQLTPEELGKLGAEKAGLDTTQGANLLNAYQKALQRMNGTFAGVLARSGSFSSTEARKALGNASSDVSA